MDEDNDILRSFEQTIEDKMPILDEDDPDTKRELEERQEELDRIGEVLATLVASLETIGAEFLKHFTKELPPSLVHTVLVGGLAMTTGVALGSIDPLQNSQLRHFIEKQIELGYKKGIKVGFALQTPMGNA